MRYLSVAIALAVLQTGSVHAGGPFDGQWKGSWGGGSSTNGRGKECQAFNGEIEMTVADGRVSGLSKGRAEARVAGTVAPDGKFTGKLGSYDMTGQFSGVKFTGSWSTTRCSINVTADKS
ncbi:MAG TPA: hypothetical protein VLX85_02840 [Stellaceae bacterium]|nr:hypothetical protein [Stellaceae bacterium]